MARALSFKILVPAGLLLLVTAAFGIWLLAANESDAAGDRPDFQANLDFFKRGRADFAVCVSDYTDAARSASDLTNRLEASVDVNKSELWRDTFLEEESIVVDSPCPKGPTFNENTRDVMDHLASVPIVEEPGPYILYVHVLDDAHFALIDELKLGGRIMAQEMADFTPNQVAGYEQVAAALYMTRAEFDEPAFLSRQIAEALGCTEGCAPQDGEIPVAQ